MKFDFNKEAQYVIDLSLGSPSDTLVHLISKALFGAYHRGYQTKELELSKIKDGPKS